MTELHTFVVERDTETDTMRLIDHVSPSIKAGHLLDKVVPGLRWKRRVIFTKAHFVLIADRLNEIVREHNLEATTMTNREKIMYEVVDALDVLFREDNPLYNSGRFWDAVYKVAINSRKGERNIGNRNAR